MLLCARVVGRVFLEYLADKGLSALGAELLDQQVDTDDRQFFRAAGAVGALPLGPFGFDIGLERYGGHGNLAIVGTGHCAGVRLQRAQLSILHGIWHCDLGMRAGCATLSSCLLAEKHRVQIDLNNPENLTLVAVRQLLASANDDEHTQLRVTKAGIAYISSGVVGGAEIGGLLFRLETWAKGSGYVGNVAANDEVWVMQIFNALSQNWPTPTSDYIDIY